ncbi:alpha-(1,6)-fucosyltransferase [Elysia marginata]|uniref:Alpha-(1,6)-fucosyltransferase n=1 Tax=Elysia marginata TaxID=1093978 RepID=A0AAV4GSP8_9GAST|nr:alpha-(1,6)-fucosyltransferase [Elysia marginata]
MKQWKLAVAMLAVWVCVLLYITSTMPLPSSSSPSSSSSFFGARSRREGEEDALRVAEMAAEKAANSLSQTLDEMQVLQKQNTELRQLLSQYSAKEATSEPSKEAAIKDLKSRLEVASQHLSELADGASDGPSLAAEQARRKVEKTVRELWFFLSSQLSKIGNQAAVPHVKLEKLKTDLEGYRRTIHDDLEKLRSVDDADEWRERKSEELGNLVQRRFEYIQNPSDCSSAKKIVCNLHKGCGFGCQLHHVTYCLITAYALKRTLILESKGWRYAPKGWETVFEPLSRTCTERGTTLKTFWGSAHRDIEKHQVIEMPIVDSLHPRPEFMPLAVPQDLGAQLEIFHGDPSVWWIGQVVRYLMRLRPEIEQDVQDAGKKMGFRNVIVGIHIRRTDKINLEAAFHSLEEYMTHVEDFYNQMERKKPGITRRVYLASDDSSVLEEAKMKYENYVFISDNSISRSAGLNTRYSDGSLRGVIIDIHYLSRCDFLVCTFSSQVCRVAYELMQTLHGDASGRFHSLDDIFYYGGQNGHNLHVLEAHPGSSSGLIQIKPGDSVGIAGNHWDGFSKGTNHRTGMSGLFPSYKAEDTVVKVSMPTYPEVPLKSSR